MDRNDTLLSFVARQHTSALEDVATNALFYILSRSASARSALSDFLGDERRPLPIAETKPWAADEHGAVPDLTCRDADGEVVAFVEAKFWAPLTHHQPVTYWEELPDDMPSVLLFLAPDFRIDQGSLWDELVGRLHKECHQLGPAVRRESLVAASAKVGKRRLMLASWRLLLDSMAERTKKEGDTQAHFQIADLQGLTDAAINGDNPKRDENLKKLIAEAVNRLKQSGWANTDRLSVGQGDDFYGRYLRLAGASAWLGIDYRAVKQIPDKALWLTFGHYSDASVSVDALRAAWAARLHPNWNGVPGMCAYQ